MTTREQNNFLAQTEPGKPMGNLLRRYWIPALLASEIAEPDCPPVRVKLLGEQLIAFRDSQGRVGVMDEFCAHRGVSLWFGRNEENGLRCPYHGWKYDVTGQCIEVPSEPIESGFCKKIKLAAYDCIERGDVIWIYMGPQDRKPPAPSFEWATVPATHRFVSKRRQECNWLQALEGGIHVKLLPGSFRPVVNKDNDYMIDRVAQKHHKSYSGVKGIAMQDAAIQESCGPVQDRSKENLVSTDNGVIMVRARLRKAALAVMEGGTPDGVDPATHAVRSAAIVLPEGENFYLAAADALVVREGIAHASV